MVYELLQEHSKLDVQRQNSSVRILRVDVDVDVDKVNNERNVFSVQKQKGMVIGQNLLLRQNKDGKPTLRRPPSKKKKSGFRPNATAAEEPKKELQEQKENVTEPPGGSMVSGLNPDPQLGRGSTTAVTAGQPKNLKSDSVNNGEKQLIQVQSMSPSWANSNKVAKIFEGK
jgi:hypothetical protein